MGYEPNELPDCSTPRHVVDSATAIHLRNPYPTTSRRRIFVNMTAIRFKILSLDTAYRLNNADRIDSTTLTRMQVTIGK